jgi:hypothetical protein
VAAWLRLRPQIEETFRQRELCSQTLGREALEHIRQSLGSNPSGPAPITTPLIGPFPSQPLAG